MDNNFYKNSGPFKVDLIAQKIDGELVKPKNIGDKPNIENIRILQEASVGDLSFLDNLKYEKYIETTKASACIVSREIADKYTFENMWLIIHPNPYFAYSLAMDLFYSPKVCRENKIEETSYIHPSAKIGKNVYIGHNSIIEENSEIADGTIISGNCYIGPGVKIGQNCRIDSNVTINYSEIGDRVVILPGACIGQDGFGFSTEKGKHKKVFHIGRVIIENDVEIGANTTIDRGVLKDTIICENVRIDNLVQIGHNVEVGSGTILVSQVGVAGSTKIGKYCAAGGQAGFAGHLEIADGARIGGQSGVISSISEAGTYFGTPALPVREWQKQNIAIKKLLKSKG